MASDYIDRLNQARSNQGISFSKPEESVDLDWASAADATQQDKPLWQTVLSAVTAPLKVLDVARGGVYSGIRTVAEQAGWAEDDERSFFDTWGDAVNNGEGFNEWFEDAGFGEDGSGRFENWSAAALGFGLDVASDPITWLSLGTSVLAKKGLQVAAKAAGAMAAKEIASAGGEKAVLRLASNNAEFLSRVGVRDAEALMAMGSDDLMKRLASNAPDTLVADGVKKSYNQVVEEAASDLISAAASRSSFIGSGRELWNDIGGVMSQSLAEGGVANADDAARAIFNSFDKNLRGGISYGAGRLKWTQDVTKPNIPGADIVRSNILRTRFAIRRNVNNLFANFNIGQSEIGKFKDALFDTSLTGDLTKRLVTEAQDPQLIQTLLSYQRVAQANAARIAAYSAGEAAVGRMTNLIRQKAINLGFDQDDEVFQTLYNMADQSGKTIDELASTSGDIVQATLTRIGNQTGQYFDDLDALTKYLDDAGQRELFDDMAVHSSLSDREGWHKELFDNPYVQGYDNRVITPQYREQLLKQGRQTGTTSSTRQRQAFLDERIVEVFDDELDDYVFELSQRHQSVREANLEYRDATGLDIDVFETNRFKVKQTVYMDLLERRSKKKFAESMLSSFASFKNPFLAKAQYEKAKLYIARDLENLLLEGVDPTDAVIEAVTAMHLGLSPKQIDKITSALDASSATGMRLARNLEGNNAVAMSEFTARNFNQLEETVRLLENGDELSLALASSQIQNIITNELALDTARQSSVELLTLQTDEALRNIVSRSLAEAVELEDGVVETLMSTVSSTRMGELTDMVRAFVNSGQLDADDAKKILDRTKSVVDKQNANVPARVGMSVLDRNEIPTELREANMSAWFAGEAVSDMISISSEVAKDRSELIKYIDGFTTAWKAYSTVSLIRGLAYHSRNLIGGMVNNFSGGVRAADMAFGAKFGSVAAKVEREIAENARLLPSQVDEFRATRFQQLWDDAKDAIEWKAEEQLYTTPGEAYAAYKRLSLDKTRSAEALERSAINDIYAHKSVKGSEKYDAIIRDERAQNVLSGKAGAVKAYNSPVTKADRFEARVRHGKLTQNKLTVSGGRLAEFTENSLRMAAFLTGSRRFGTAEGGAMFTKALHFDYGDLTSFEKSVMKRVIPFWAWQRNNIPLQARLFLNRPAGFQNLVELRDAAIEAFADPGIDQELVPDWAQSKLGFLANSPLTPGGMIIVRMETPKLDLMEWIDQDGWNGEMGDLPFLDIRSGINALAASTSPVANMGNELSRLTTGIAFDVEGKYGLKQFDDYNSPTEAATSIAQYLYRTTPLSAQIGDAGDIVAGLINSDYEVAPGIQGERSKSWLNLIKYTGLNVNMSGISDEKIAEYAAALEREDRQEFYENVYEEYGIDPTNRAVASNVRRAAVQNAKEEGFQSVRKPGEDDAKALLRRYTGRS